MVGEYFVLQGTETGYPIKLHNSVTSHAAFANFTAVALPTDISMPGSREVTMSTPCTTHQFIFLLHISDTTPVSLSLNLPTT